MYASSSTKLPFFHDQISSKGIKNDDTVYSWNITYRSRLFHCIVNKNIQAIEFE